MALTPYQVPASCIPVLRDLQRAACLILRLRLPKNRNMRNLERLAVEAETVLRSQQRLYPRLLKPTTPPTPPPPQPLAPMSAPLLDFPITKNTKTFPLL